MENIRFMVAVLFIGIETKCCIYIPEFCFNKNWLCPENCVIIGRKGNINKPIFVETKFWNVDTAFGLNANKEYLLPKFLYYFCLDYNFERHNKAVTIPSLTKADLLKIDIPLPPKSTQLAIVSELDKINELIRLKKEQLKDFDNLAQSLFYEMFGDPVENEMGWEVKTFGEIGSVERGAGISKKDFVKEGLPCIHYGQLHTILGPRTTKHFTSIPHNLLPKYKIAHTGDLVMAITSEDVEGSCKSTVWLGDYDIIVGSDAAIFHHKQDGTFLSYYTMTKSFLEIPAPLSTEPISPNVFTSHPISFSTGSPNIS
jgi:type I restriction enzyme, S subunit